METKADTNLLSSYKKEIRKEILAKRNMLSKEEWESKSESIFQKVISHPFFLEAEEIYCYIDYKNEVGTQKIIEKAWELRKKVAVPKIIGDEMHFFYINSFEEVEEGYCRILEPTTKQIAEGKNVLVIMPGAVFDKEHNRIGYGKGFYDRYLEKHPTYHTLALAFLLQFIENIPADTHDKKPEVIITEENDDGV